MNWGVFLAAVLQVVIATFVVAVCIVIIGSAVNQVRGKK